MPYAEEPDACGCGQHRPEPLPVATDSSGRSASPGGIGAQTNVRAILAGCPGAAAVFERHGLMGCGGVEGPDEPLELFARAHHVELGPLLAELAITDAPSARPLPRVSPAPARYRRFIATGLAFALTFGAGLGALLLATSTLPWGFLGGLSSAAARTAHAHAQVFGFAALFIMGVAYHAVPRMKSTALAEPRLAGASYWLEAGGALLVTLGALIAPPAGAVVRSTGSAAVLAAALAFGWVIDRTLTSGAPSEERFEAWVRAGCVWLVLAAAFALAAAAGASALQPVVWDAALYGFVASWILGFSRRILPAFMGIAPAARHRSLVCGAYQTTVALWVGTALLEVWWRTPAVRMLAGTALAAAGVVAVWRLGVFARRERPGGAIDRGFEPFVFAAYVWLLIGFACGPAWSAAAVLVGVPMPALVLDFGRHALTLGFLTQMIVGIATRIIPVFSGQALWSRRWRGATFALLNAAVLVRGLQVVVELGGPEGLWPWIALSGGLGFAAFASFALNLFMTLSGRGSDPIRRAAPTAAPSAESLVADLLAIPGALDLLVARGFAPLRNPAMRATLAHTVTLRTACRLHGIAVEPLLDELRVLAPAAVRMGDEHATVRARPAS